ncbi:FAD-dependent oxidoreductase [Devosia aurantiaca]|uniref:NAD(P)-binding protein n=1 Tax=Devosia aurantiaca TaxID=2714858 RepID=A0A6M1SRR5_9HYPH|nr:FAD-dependent oxidoreductase [Devosia aurantiaca]NGP17885.1 NAD(P)-binding protein [Devosia aurantiaca]
MPAEGRSFIIAGAGISGLTLALALAKWGATVVVLEKARRCKSLVPASRSVPTRGSCSVNSDSMNR